MHLKKNKRYRKKIQCLFLKGLGRRCRLKAGGREERMGFVVSTRPPSFVPAPSHWQILQFQSVKGTNKAPESAEPSPANFFENVPWQVAGLVVKVS